MAEEFQGGICGGNWWSSSRGVFMAASPCSVGLNHDVAGFGWTSHDMVDGKLARSSSGLDTNSICDSTSNNNITTCGFQEVQKPHHQIMSHDISNNSVSGSGSVSIDSTLQVMGFGLSTSPSSDLNQSNNNFVNSRRREESNNIYSMLQEDMGTKLNYRSQEIGLLDSPSHHQIQKADILSGNCGTVTTTTSQAMSLSAGFPMSSSPASNYGYSSTSATLLQSLFGAGEAHHDHQLPHQHQQQQQQQQSAFSNNRSMNNNSQSTPVNYGSNNLGNTNNSNMVSSSWQRFSGPKLLQQPGGGLQFSNNTPFWIASESGPNDNNINRAGLFTSPLPQQLQYVTPTFEEKPKCNNFTPKTNEGVQDLGSVVQKSASTDHQHHPQPVLKRARIETPSPLPTFKVRKEKLGDRITALQQLVSPFGKTDTASVLHEAIEYIKFLHDQVSVLSTPYMKNRASIQVQQQDQEMTPKQDLKSRGLCLVPISSTFPVANETTADFWTPTFGGSFR